MIRLFARLYCWFNDYCWRHQQKMKSYPKGWGCYDCVEARSARHAERLKRAIECAAGKKQ